MTANIHHDTAAAGTNGQVPKAISGRQWADERDLDPDETPIRAAVSEDTWRAVKTFMRKHGIEQPYYGTTGSATENMVFADLPVVPVHVVRMDLPDLNLTRSQIAEFAEDTHTADPHVTLDRLKRERSQKYLEWEQTSKALAAAKVDPAAEFSLDEIERVCGPASAEAARKHIERHNRDTWNGKLHREEHTYLVTASELLAEGKGVPVEVIAKMNLATKDERSLALQYLADAREAHAAGGFIDHARVKGRWLSLDDLDTLPESEWLVDKLVPARALSRWVGPPASLKSFLALDIALSVATGQPFAGWSMFPVTEARPVVYVVAEGVAGVNKRIRAWCQERKIDRAVVSRNLTLLNGAAQLASRRDMEDMAAKVKETGAALVIFDTQARCTVDLEENSATQQGRAIANLDMMRHQADATVLVVHHTSDANKAKGRGSSVWRGALDSEVVVSRDGKTLNVDIEVTKTKDDEDGQQYPLKAVKVDLPGGISSLVFGSRDPYSDVDLNAPMEEWTGKGSAYAAGMYELAQRHCIPGEGLTQTRLAEIANEVVRTDHSSGKEKKIRRVCSKHTATAAIKLLVEHQRLVESRRDNLDHVFYQPVDYPPSDPKDISGLPTTTPDGEA